MEQSADSLAEDVRRKFGDQVVVRRGVPAAALTTFSLGGIIEALYLPQTLDALLSLVQFFVAQGVEWRVLGGGSNLLVADCGLSSPVISFGGVLTKMGFLDEPGLTIDGFLRLCAEGLPEAPSEAMLLLGGAALMTASRKASAAGFSGLEFAAGIPAAAGGAVRMNAGAHGSCLGDILKSAFVIRRTGVLACLSAAELSFAYRHSSISEGDVVVGALLELRRGNAAEVMERRHKSLEYRKTTQPLNLPSAGSVFRNPERAISEEARLEFGLDRTVPAAAQLLQACGLKGRTVGGAGYSELHANWIVKLSDSAKAQDVLDLIALGQESVLARFGIPLQPELVVWR